MRQIVPLTKLSREILEECLESHTARRPFITRAITKGIPLNVIMGITGHTRIETLTRYMVKYTPTIGYRELLEE